MVQRLNARVCNKPKFFKLRSGWHTVKVHVSWPRFILASLGIWLLLHVLFALLFFCEASWSLRSVMNINNQGDSLLWVLFRCFCFSVQTGQTIGYGWLAPLSPYANTIVCIDTFVIMVFQVVFTGIFTAKLAQPQRIAAHFVFSDVAVVTRGADYFRSDNGVVGDGEYVADGALPTLQFRVLNAGKSMLCSAQLKLLLLRQITAPHESTAPTSETTRKYAAEVIAKKPRLESAFVWKIDELNCEMDKAEQQRVRVATTSIPLLPLPWTVSHTIDETSPLAGFSPSDFERSHAEIIIVIEGIDEGCSQCVQARWSFTPNEVRWGAAFDPCVEVRGGMFVISADRLSAWHWEHFSEAPDHNFEVDPTLGATGDGML